MNIVELLTMLLTVVQSNCLDICNFFVLSVLSRLRCYLTSYLTVPVVNRSSCLCLNLLVVTVIG